MPSSRSPAKQRAKTLAKGRTWAEDVLMSLKIPVNVTNVTALRLWAQLENAAPTRHNWLNTTLTMPGATTLPGNPDHVKSYPSYAEGVAATAKSLRTPQYAAVVRALATKAATTDRTPYTPHASFSRPVLAKIFDAINQSPWDGRMTGTHTRQIYPSTIYAVLNGGKLPPTMRTPTNQRATGTGATGRQGSRKPPKCAWQITWPVFGSSCILNENELRNLKGGLLLVGGGLIMLVGVGMLAAFGFGSSAAQRQLRRAGIGGSSSVPGSPPSRPAPNTTSSPAPETQAERNRRQVEALPPDVRDEARRRREAYGLQASSTPRPAPAPAAPARPAPAEQRPRAQATSSRSTRTGQPSRRAKRPHGRTTGLGPRARARRR